MDPSQAFNLTDFSLKLMGEVASLLPGLILAFAGAAAAFLWEKKKLIKQREFSIAIDAYQKCNSNLNDLKILFEDNLDELKEQLAFYPEFIADNKEDIDALQLNLSTPISFTSMEDELIQRIFNNTQEYLELLSFSIFEYYELEVSLQIYKTPFSEKHEVRAEINKLEEFILETRNILYERHKYIENSNFSSSFFDEFSSFSRFFFESANQVISKLNFLIDLTEINKVTLNLHK